MDTKTKIILGTISLTVLIIVIVYLSGTWLKIYGFVCEKINNVNRQGNCFFNLAKIKDDSEVCQRIKNYSIKNDCYYYFAFKKENIELCNTTGERKNDCYLEFIDRYASEELCKNIYYVYKYECYHKLAFQKKDLNFCDEVSSERKKCYEDIVRKYPNEDLCEKIGDDSNKKDCYYYLATVNKLVEYCDKTLKPMDCCREVIGDRINKGKERELQYTIKEEEKEINGVKFVIGRKKAEESKKFNIGTGNLYFSKRGAGISYFYLGDYLDVSPYLSVANIIPHSPCFLDYPGYEGLNNFCEFTSLKDYSFDIGSHNALLIGDKTSCCNQGILIFKQGGLYGAIDFLYTNEYGDLYYDYWFDTTGGANFNLLCEKK